MASLLWSYIPPAGRPSGLELRASLLNFPRAHIVRLTCLTSMPAGGAYMRYLESETRLDEMNQWLGNKL